MKETGKQKILKYLKQNKSITQLEALKLFWDWRLSAKIHELKKDGYNIKSEDIKVQKSDGTYGYVAKYTLLEE